MTTAESLRSEPPSSRLAPRTSFLGALWQRWLKKRERDRARQLAHVRFRLTREGVHFVGILAFIFVGAVIREINLLILLAGAMIGLLLLQWRFNTSTLAGLTVHRKLSRSIQVGQPAEVAVQVSNPKFFLGAWLIVVQDRIQLARPRKQRLADTGTALLDAIQPRSSARTKYELKFHQRGEYRIGPTTMSTRFPLSLGIGWRTIENTSSLIVHPQQGHLSDQVRELFQLDQLGQAKSSAQAATQEGEFFGLRPWATGDSRRWIHWRTTARLGQLSVRQFERQQRRQVNVLLDLHRSGRAEEERICDLAISFVATLASASVKHGRDRLAVGVAAEHVRCFENIVSPLLVNTLLDELAVANSCKEPDLTAAIQGMSIPLMNNPYLLVISTRGEKPDLARSLDRKNSVMHRLLSGLRIRWMNVSAGDLEPYFQWI